MAEAQRARLLKVLHSRTLPLRKRAQLWVACVRSSALYGLHLLDLQQKHVGRITVVLAGTASMELCPHVPVLLRQVLRMPFLLRAGQKLLTKTNHKDGAIAMASTHHGNQAGARLACGASNPASY